MRAKGEEAWQRMRWLDSITDSMDVNLNKSWKIVEDRGAWHAAAHGVAKSWTRLTNWTTAATMLEKPPFKWVLFTLTCDSILIDFHSISENHFCSLEFNGILHNSEVSVS